MPEIKLSIDLKVTLNALEEVTKEDIDKFVDFLLIGGSIQTKILNKFQSEDLIDMVTEYTYEKEPEDV